MMIEAAFVAYRAKSAARESVLAGNEKTETGNDENEGTRPATIKEGRERCG
jgi:hypothetical protein